MEQTTEKVLNASGGAPRAKNFLERKFLDFKEL